MNDHKNNPNTISWIDHIKKISNIHHRQFFVLDNRDNQIILEWELVDSMSCKLNQLIKDSSEILVQMYTSMELQFVKQYPETVSSEMFLKPLEPLFKDGLNAVDWKVVEQQLSMNLQQFLTTTDFAKYGNANDIQIFVIAKDAQSGQQLGIIQFVIMSQFEYGTIKVAMFGVEESAFDRGIESLLLSSVFRLIPDVFRIFLHTRITNDTFINLYQQLGFKRFTGPLPFWMDMEYLTEKSDILQTISKSLKK